ncbi:MAG: hypothetical protein M4579_007024 [Chaenotheca gracillima]|nr:MAG: hypothetical protein M4579_007024 [Chaenotheca gracillima]
MARHLPSLPVEIIERIAFQSTLADLRSFRLVCQTLYQKTLYYFGHTYLKRLKTDLTDESLQRLQGISETDHFRHHVETLIVKQKSMGPDDYRIRFDNHQHQSRFLPAWLAEALPAFRLLVDILLHRLVNCRSFKLHGFPTMGRYAVPQRLQRSDAVELILGMIAESGLPFKSFVLDCGSFDTPPVDMGWLRMARYRNPEFLNTWAHLEELSLIQTLQSEDFDWLLDLVKDATGLRTLLLQTVGFYSDSFIERLSLTPQLAPVQELSLVMVDLKAVDASRLLLHFRDSLRVLSFLGVNLLSGTWAEVLQDVRANLPGLQSINVVGLTRRTSESVVFPTLLDDPVVPDSGGRRFSLPRRDYYKDKVPAGVSYDGPGFDAALEKLAKSVRLSRRLKAVPD